MLLVFIRLFLFMIPMVLVWTQVVGPMLKGDPTFPLLRGKPQHVRDAERNLLAAQAAKKAADLNEEAARLNEETWSRTERLYENTLEAEEN